jgi:predicted site-specific integrase-resolvase
MKSMKQIADALGIEKQKVYRYIKKHNINEVHQDGSTLYYNDTLETEINKHYSERPTSSESLQTTSDTVSNASNDTVIQALINQLEVKDKQIADLNAQIKELTEAVKIQAASINADRHNELAETIFDSQAASKTLSATNNKSVGFWGKLFKKNK